mgnify:FL=1
MRRGTIGAVALAVGLLASGSVLACSCRPVSREAVIERAEVAFRGEIVASGKTRDGREVVARVRVISPIKGRVPAMVTVTSTAVAGRCGYPLHPGATLDFAGRLDERGRMGVGMCGMVPLNASPWGDQPR